MSSEELQLFIYQCQNGSNVELKSFDGNTLWATRNQIATLFDCSIDNIDLHIKNILLSHELDEKSTTEKISVVQKEGNRMVHRDSLLHYNLDMIIAVGYRVNSAKATQFRIWATKILKEYLIKGFVMDDERLKDPNNKAYFKEILERVREIRTSEKLFYQQVRDIYTTATDYELRKNDKDVQTFFAEVQNKLLYAITGRTAAEIVVERHNKEDNNFGTTHYEGSKVRKGDVFIAKNYLTEKELKLLKLLVNLLLDHMETQAEREIPMTIDDWKQETEDIIRVSKYPLLQNCGNISHEKMKELVEKDYNDFNLERKNKELEEAREEAIAESRKEVIEFIKNKRRIKNNIEKNKITQEILKDNPELEHQDNQDFDIVFDKIAKK